jgi:hypothetical protein
VHEWLNEWGPEVQNDDGYRTVAIDATQVSKWKENGQITLGIAHEIVGAAVYHCPTVDRFVVGCVAGAEEDLKPILEETTIERTAKSA